MYRTRAHTYSKTHKAFVQIPMITQVVSTLCVKNLISIEGVSVKEGSKLCQWDTSKMGYAELYLVWQTHLELTKVGCG